MKVLHIGDMHHGEKGNSKEFNQQINAFAGWAAKISKEYAVDAIVQGGDFFHTRHKIDVFTLNSGVESAKSLSSYVGRENTYILTGNHDLYYLERLDVSSVNALREYVTVIDDVTVLPEYDMVLTPWVVDAEQWDHIVNLSIDHSYCVGHFEFAGFKLNDGYRMEHGHSHKSLNRYKRVISSHYHSPQELDNVKYLGTPYPITMNEANEAHGVYIHDTDTDELLFIEYDAVKVVSVPYEELEAILPTLTDPENTTIRVEFSENITDQSIISECIKSLTERGFSEVKEKSTNAKVREVLEETRVDMDGIESIDGLVMQGLDNMVPIDGVDSSLMAELYLEAKRRGEA